jgi:hypothetical protein
VGRSLNSEWYERLSNSDFRKKSWLSPKFFEEETDEDGCKKFYRLNGNPSAIRSRINKGSFPSYPKLYVSIKFRPRGGNCETLAVGGATDYPIMRVEEMYFLKAEATLHTKGPAAASTALCEIVGTRYDDPAEYNPVISNEEDFIDEYTFQKGIEFWGEGINYFDAKRLKLGIHRGEATNCGHTHYKLDVVDGVFVGWTPGWNEAELNKNKAIYNFNNPYTDPSFYRVEDEKGDGNGEEDEEE